jgi:versiconal hemiacetal acetate esterase
MSAGGTLALALALGDSSVKGVVALGPPTVAPSQVPAHLKSLFKPEENTDSAIIDGAGMKVYSDAYGAPADSTDVSVLNHANLAKLPPTYLVVTGKDPLRDDGIALEQELKAKGVKVKSDHYDGFPHLFWIVPGLETGTTAVNNIVGGINWVLSEM